MADINGLSGIGLDFFTNALNSVTGSGNNNTSQTVEGTKSFETLFNSAMNMISDFSLGNTESTHELTIAQQKAYLSLQYTVAIKNGLLDAYKEIMNIQI